MDAKKWYYAENEKQKGPFTKQELTQVNICVNTLVWSKGMKKWKPIQNISELSDVIKVLPPEVKGNVILGYNYTKLNPLKYTWLIFFFGIIGAAIGRFYYYCMFCHKMWPIPKLFYDESVKEKVIAGHSELLEAATISGIFSGLFNITYSVFLFIFIYKTWKFLSKDSDISPGKAVGLLFIPFYNFYWFFVVFRGFAKRVNKLIQDEPFFDNLKLNTKLATVIPILAIMSMVLGLLPGGGDVLAFIFIICFPIYVFDTIKKLNMIKDELDNVNKDNSIEFINFIRCPNCNKLIEKSIFDYINQTKCKFCQVNLSYENKKLLLAAKCPSCNRLNILTNNKSLQKCKCNTIIIQKGNKFELLLCPQCNKELKLLYSDKSTEYKCSNCQTLLSLTPENIQRISVGNLEVKLIKALEGKNYVVAWSLCNQIIQFDKSIKFSNNKVLEKAHQIAINEIDIYLNNHFEEHLFISPDIEKGLADTVRKRWGLIMQDNEVLSNIKRVFNYIVKKRKEKLLFYIENNNWESALIICDELEKGQIYDNHDVTLLINEVKKIVSTQIIDECQIKIKENPVFTRKDLTKYIKNLPLLKNNLIDNSTIKKLNKSIDDKLAIFFKAKLKNLIKQKKWFDADDIRSQTLKSTATLTNELVILLKTVKHNFLKTCLKYIIFFTITVILFFLSYKGIDKYIEVQKNKNNINYDSKLYKEWSKKYLIPVDKLKLANINLANSLITNIEQIIKVPTVRNINFKEIANNAIIKYQLIQTAIYYKIEYNAKSLTGLYSNEFNKIYLYNTDILPNIATQLFYAANIAAQYGELEYSQFLLNINGMPNNIFQSKKKLSEIIQVLLWEKRYKENKMTSNSDEKTLAKIGAIGVGMYLQKAIDDKELKEYIQQKIMIIDEDAVD